VKKHPRRPDRDSDRYNDDNERMIAMCSVDNLPCDGICAERNGKYKTEKGKRDCPAKFYKKSYRDGYREKKYSEDIQVEKIKRFRVEE